MQVREKEKKVLLKMKDFGITKIDTRDDQFVIRYLSFDSNYENARTSISVGTVVDIPLTLIEKRGTLTKMLSEANPEKEVIEFFDSIKPTPSMQKVLEVVEQYKQSLSKPQHKKTDAELESKTLAEYIIEANDPIHTVPVHIKLLKYLCNAFGVTSRIGYPNCIICNSKTARILNFDTHTHTTLTMVINEHVEDDTVYLTMVNANTDLCQPGLYFVTTGKKYEFLNCEGENQVIKYKFANLV
jgi:hypothetical protein